MCQVKAKDSEIKPYPLCLSNLSKNFIIDNINKTGLKGHVHVFSVDYDIIHTNNILYIRKYLKKIT